MGQACQAPRTAASPKPSVTAPRRLSEVVVGRGMGIVTDWTALTVPEPLTMASRKKKKKEWKRVSAESTT